MIQMLEKKKLFTVSGILLISFSCAYVFSLSKNKQALTNERKSVDSYTDKFSEFSTGTKMSVNYLTTKSKNIYTVQYVLISNGSDYIDIELQVNKETNKINTSLTGLPDTAKVSLVIGQASYHSDIPVDWAGRLVLTSNNIDFLNESDICLKIDGLYNNKKSILCHNAADTAERQVQS